MSEQEFEQYLERFVRRLGLTAAQRKAIARELRDHLETRMEELTGEGQSREAAIEVALAEFGDEVGLARRFRLVAHHQLRRRIMRTSLGLSSVATLILAVAYLLPEGRVGVPDQAVVVAEERDEEARAGEEEERDRALEAALERRAAFEFEDVPLEEAFGTFLTVQDVRYATDALAQIVLGSGVGV